MFKNYRKRAITEAREVTEDDIKNFRELGYISTPNGNTVSISDADLNNGSPKLGDKIARNQVNRDGDQWLIAEAYFNQNYEEA